MRSATVRSPDLLLALAHLLAGEEQLLAPRESVFAVCPVVMKSAAWSPDTEVDALVDCLRSKSVAPLRSITPCSARRARARALATCSPGLTRNSARHPGSRVATVTRRRDSAAARRRRGRRRGRDPGSRAVVAHQSASTTAPCSAAASRRAGLVATPAWSSSTWTAPAVRSPHRPSFSTRFLPIAYKETGATLRGRSVVPVGDPPRQTSGSSSSTMPIVGLPFTAPRVRVDASRAPPSASRPSPVRPSPRSRAPPPPDRPLHDARPTPTDRLKASIMLPGYPTPRPPPSTGPARGTDVPA